LKGLRVDQTYLGYILHVPGIIREKETGNWYIIWQVKAEMTDLPTLLEEGHQLTFHGKHCLGIVSA
jgi:hypothetical protein